MSRPFQEPQAFHRVVSVPAGQWRGHRCSWRDADRQVPQIFSAGGQEVVRTMGDGSRRPGRRWGSGTAPAAISPGYTSRTRTWFPCTFSPPTRPPHVPVPTGAHYFRKLPLSSGVVGKAGMWKGDRYPLRRILCLGEVWRPKVREVLRGLGPGGRGPSPRRPGKKVDT